jgi:hypothetical protein
MQIKYKIILLFSLLALIASSCPEENPDLVTPPSFSETVNVRFLNLSRNAQLALGFDEEKKTLNVGYYGFTDFFNPKNDSAFVSLYENNNMLFELERVVHFMRDINYVFTAVPNPLDFSKDTLYSFTNIGDIVVTEVEASVKFINLYADNEVSFSVVRGCPGGTSITSSFLRYLDNTPAEAQRADGDFIFSILKIIGNDFEIVGTYRTNFRPEKEYAILISGRENQPVDIFVIDELDLNSGLNEAQFVDNQVAKVKLNNLRSEPEVLIFNGMNIADIGANYQSNFIEMSACVSTSAETFTISSGSEVLFSPVVNEKYNAITYNTPISSSNTFGSELIIIPPPILNQNRVGKPVVRCLNLGNTEAALNVSIAANSNFINPNNQEAIRNFSSGVTLARRLDYQRLSQPVIIGSGYLPILVFNSREPADYLNSFVFNFEKDRNYLIVSYYDNGDTKYTVIDETKEDAEIPQFEEASIINFVNGDLSKQNHLIGLSNEFGTILENANVIYGGTLTSLISPSNAKLTFTDFSKNINIDPAKRILAIKNSDDIYTFQNNKVTPVEGGYRVRIANFSDKENIKISFQSGFQIKETFENINRFELSEYRTELSQGRIFVIADDLNTETTFFTSNEVNVSRYKLYTLVIVGNQINGYRLINLQDY